MLHWRHLTARTMVLNPLFIKANGSRGHNMVIAGETTKQSQGCKVRAPIVIETTLRDDKK
jgi:hypothetical protein